MSCQIYSLSSERIDGKVSRAAPKLRPYGLKLDNISILLFILTVQAMDRAHRIGQDKPVLVLRLATGNSVDGRMLKRANSKLMLERLVIRKGAFLPSDAKEAEEKQKNLTNEELMELLEDTMPLKNEPQSGVVTDKVNFQKFSLILKLYCESSSVST